MSKRSKALIGVFGVMFVALAVMVMMNGGPREYWNNYVANSAGPRVPLASSPRRAPAATRPTSREATQYDPTLLRELPRQALLITESEQFGLPVCDRSVDFDAPQRGSHLACTIIYDQRANLRGTVTIKDEKGAALKSIELPVPVLNQLDPDYGKIAPLVESWCDSTFVPLLKSAGFTPKPKAGASATSPATMPAELEEQLLLIEPQRAFLAARTIHATIAASGETPERSAALVRAYSNLGESTRYLYSAHGSAFFARALIYAERLVRQNPNLPLAHAARGYAYALLGQYNDARRSFERARELAVSTGGVIPEWATLADEMSRFHTRALVDRIGGSPLSPLTSYFAFLTVEQSKMSSVVTNVGKLALQDNLSAMRVVAVLTESGAGKLHYLTTEQLRKMQFDAIAMLAEDPAAPDSVQSAANDAKGKRFAPDALMALFATMDQEPVEDGQLLPWSTFASISRDELFFNGFLRLFYTGHLMGADTSERFKAWWPMLKDHRFAYYLRGYDTTGPLGDKETRKAIREVTLDDFIDRHREMLDIVRRHDATLPPEHRKWMATYEFGWDHTGYDEARNLWTFHGKEGDEIAILGLLKGFSAESLAKMYPDHPLALSEMIVNRWPQTKPRAAEIERDMGGHPEVGYALARAYRSEKRYAEAARLLEQVIVIAPEREVYEELADVYMDQGDADKWLAVSEKYLREGSGRDNDEKNAQIAYVMLRMGKPDRALKYAKTAAETGSFKGTRAYIDVLTETGQFDEAEKVAKAAQDMYPPATTWYRWCQITGRGDLKAAKVDCEAAAKAAEQHEPAQWEEHPVDLVVYLYLEGQLDRARALWEKANKRKADAYVSLQLALLDLEQGKSQDDVWEKLEAAKAPPSIALPPELAAMMGNVTTDRDEARNKIYRLAAEEILRCLDKPGAAPRRDGDMQYLLDAHTAPARACAAYFIGRFCELRGMKDDAKWWYRTSLETQEWNTVCRVQSAVGLRRLGEDLYK